MYKCLRQRQGILSYVSPRIGLGVGGSIPQFVRFATKKSGGSTSNNKDSAGRRLGVKKGKGSFVIPGNIIVRQRGSKIYPGENVKIGKDFTIWAVEPGYVRFYLDPFHPLRKHVGVALERDQKLPTPHFNPRSRRLGYRLLTDPKAIELEREHMSRKEYLGRDALQAEIQSREALRLKRREALKERFIELHTADKLDGDIEQAVDRLCAIQNLQLGGRTYKESVALADENFRNSLFLRKEHTGMSDEEYQETLTKYDKLAEEIDSLVMFNCQKKLVKYVSEKDMQAQRKSVLQELRDFEYPLPVSRKSRVFDLVTSPCFSRSESCTLRRKYYKPVLSPRQVKQPTTEEELIRLTEAKLGAAVRMFDHEKRRERKIFLPYAFVPDEAAVMNSSPL